MIGLPDYSSLSIVVSHFLPAPEGVSHWLKTKYNLFHWSSLLGPWMPKASGYRWKGTRYLWNCYNFTACCLSNWVYIRPGFVGVPFLSLQYGFIRFKPCTWKFVNVDKQFIINSAQSMIHVSGSMINTAIIIIRSEGENAEHLKTTVFLMNELFFQNNGYLKSVLLFANIHVTLRFRVYCFPT